MKYLVPVLLLVGSMGNPLFSTGGNDYSQYTSRSPWLSMGPVMVGPLAIGFGATYAYPFTPKRFISFSGLWARELESALMFPRNSDGSVSELSAAVGTHFHRVEYRHTAVSVGLALAIWKDFEAAGAGSDSPNHPDFIQLSIPLALESSFTLRRMGIGLQLRMNEAFGYNYGSLSLILKIFP